MDRSRSSLYSSAGALLTGSAVVALVGNAFHPRLSSAGLDDPGAYAADVGASTLWLVVHLVLLAAVVGILVGLIGLGSHLATEDRPRAWAWATVAVTAVVGGFSMMTIVVDGIALSMFAGAADTAGAGAIAAIDLAGFSGLALLTFGLLPMVLGLALVRSDAYPHWTGFVALTAGVIGIVTGVIVAAAAEITPLATVLFLIGSFALTLDVVWLGVLLRRHAMAPAAGAAASAA